MGYIAFVILALLLLAFGVVIAVRGKRPPSGRIEGHGAILREEPSADAPTPARSSTAAPDERAAADKHTPPA
jgi:hypothetical protein